VAPCALADQLRLLGGLGVELELKGERGWQSSARCQWQPLARKGGGSVGVVKGKEWREVGRRGGAGLRSEVFLALSFFEFRSEFSEIAARCRERRQRCCLRSISVLEVAEAVEVMHLGRVHSGREASEITETFLAVPWYRLLCRGGTGTGL